MRRSRYLLFAIVMLISGIGRATSAQGDAPVLVGAGDISACSLPGDDRTADLLDQIEGTVFTVGDNVYPDGTLEQFETCYEPTWGRHKRRTRPTLGNHDYNTKGAEGYFEYFGNRARPEGRSYYSYDLGTWHIVALNSNIDARPEGLQGEWLREDLRTHPGKCTLVYFHHPLFVSRGGGTERMTQFWEVLYRYGVDVIINGDVHYYERFMPQTPTGQPDTEHGIRQFIVGTGGATLARTVGERGLPTSEVRDNSTNGVIKLTLHDGSYEWEFIPIVGGTFHDAGSSPCVDPAQAVEFF
jgi:acid phosphatase type 7